MEPEELLYLGKSFNSYLELDAAVQAYQKKNFVQLYKRTSSSIAVSQKRAPKRIYRDELVYGHIDYSCIYGSRQFKSKGSGQRKRQLTNQTGCPFKIRVQQSYDGQTLYVYEMRREHNHEISEAAFQKLPSRRSLDKNEREKVRYLLNLKCCKKLVRQQIIAETGKPVTMKDIQNIATLMKIDKKRKSRSSMKTSDEDSLAVEGLNKYFDGWYEGKDCSEPDSSRVLSNDERAYAEILCSLHIPVDDVKRKLQEATGKNVATADVTNVIKLVSEKESQNLRAQANEEDLINEAKVLCEKLTKKRKNQCSFELEGHFMELCDSGKTIKKESVQVTLPSEIESEGLVNSQGHQNPSLTLQLPQQAPTISNPSMFSGSIRKRKCPAKSQGHQNPSLALLLHQAPTISKPSGLIEASKPPSSRLTPPGSAKSQGHQNPSLALQMPQVPTISNPSGLIVIVPQPTSNAVKIKKDRVSLLPKVLEQSVSTSETKLTKAHGFKELRPKPSSVPVLSIPMQTASKNMPDDLVPGDRKSVV